MTGAVEETCFPRRRRHRMHPVPAHIFEQRLKSADRRSGRPDLLDERRQDDVNKPLTMSKSENSNRERGHADEDEHVDEDGAVYSVNVSQFETGQVHQVNGARVTTSAELREGCELAIDTDGGEADHKLSFVTREYFGVGRKADRLLADLLGAQFVDQKLSVYRGNIVFRYRD